MTEKNLQMIRPVPTQVECELSANELDLVTGGNGPQVAREILKWAGATIAARELGDAYDDLKRAGVDGLRAFNQAFTDAYKPSIYEIQREEKESEEMWEDIENGGPKESTHTQDDPGYENAHITQYEVTYSPQVMGGNAHNHQTHSERNTTTSTEVYDVGIHGDGGTGGGSGGWGSHGAGGAEDYL